MATEQRLPASVEAVHEARRHGGFVQVEDVWSTSVILEIDAPQLTVHQLFAARDDVVAFVHHVDEVFSTFKAHSLVSQLRDGRLCEADIEALAAGGNRGAAELLQVLQLCRRALVDTRGAFDPWAVAGGFDPSGLVKGWAAGVALDILRSHGVRRAYVDCGGDIHVMSDGAPWPTGIADPDDGTRIVKLVQLHEGAIATSGTYERGAHMVNPHDGGRSRGAVSATVVGPDPALADAYATAICVDGVNAIEWFIALGDAWSMYLVPGDVRDEHGQRVAYKCGSAFDA